MIDKKYIMDKKQIQSQFRLMLKELKTKWDDTQNLEEYSKNMNLEFPILNKKY